MEGANQAEYKVQASENNQPYIFSAQRPLTNLNENRGQEIERVSQCPVKVLKGMIRLMGCFWIQEATPSTPGTTLAKINRHFQEQSSVSLFLRNLVKEARADDIESGLIKKSGPNQRERSASTRGRSGERDHSKSRGNDDFTLHSTMTADISDTADETILALLSTTTLREDRRRTLPRK